MNDELTEILMNNQVPEIDENWRKNFEKIKKENKDFLNVFLYGEFREKNSD